MKLLIFIGMLLISSISFAQDIWISEVKNLTVSGPVVGNRDLSFGVRNIIEELVQDKDLDINPNSKNTLQVDILYFDVKKTGVQVGAFSKKTDDTEIIVRGTLFINGDKNKEVIAKGNAKSVSSATLIIDEGGKFSQSDVSTALKKVCENLINQLKL